MAPVDFNQGLFHIYLTVEAKAHPALNKYGQSLLGAAIA